MPAKKLYNDLDAQGTRTLVNLKTPVNNGDAVPKLFHDNDITAAKARANHTGTQTASTISDFDTQVRTSRLDQLAAATSPITVPNGTLATHAATKGQLDSAINALTSGQVLKGAVEAYVTTNVNIASPGTTLDGITATNGEIYFLAGQTTASQNGPYVFNGSGAAMTRATNWDENTESVLGSYWIVKRGTSADAFALVTNDTAITIGTTAITSVVRGLATAAAVVDYSETCPATSAGGTWTVTHGLNITSAIAQVIRVGSPYDVIDVFITLQPGNVATVQPDIAFAAGEYRIAIHKTS